MVYIDWEWYESNFPQLPEDEFARGLPAAEMKVDILTHNRRGMPLDTNRSASMHAWRTLSTGWRHWRRAALEAM